MNAANQWLTRLSTHPAWLVVVLLLLHTFLVLPALALPISPLTSDSGWREIFVFLWLNVDLGFLLVFLWLGHHTGRQRLFVGLGAALWFLAVVYETYDVFIVATFNRRAVLYNDLLLVPDALNLALDLAPGFWPIVLFAVTLVMATIAWVGCATLFRVAARLRLGRKAGLVVAAIGLLVLAVHFERGLASRDSIVQSSLLRLVGNLGESIAMRQALAEIAAAPSNAEEFLAALERVRLRAPPNIFLLVVESYGSVLLENPVLAGSFARAGAAFEQRLAAAGWLVATTRSDSPVVGGMSWLAGASLLGGVEIANQHLFQRFISAPPYALPSFLAAQGYHTITVQAANRERPGRPLGDPYGFDTVLFRAELDYQGRPFGWGVVPDQFSLGRAQEIASQLPRPAFVHVVTVSSHAPWDQIPPILNDWRGLNHDPELRKSWGTRLLDKLQQRFGARPSAGASTAAYLDAISYELAVLGGLLDDAGYDPALADSLFVVVGDHQPPFFAAGADVSTPLHFITRDRELFSYLCSVHGFEKGFFSTAGRSRRLSHAGFYSLLANSLAAVYGEGNPLPEVLPRGMPPAALFAPQRP